MIIDWWRWWIYWVEYKCIQFGVQVAWAIEHEWEDFSFFFKLLRFEFCHRSGFMGWKNMPLDKFVLRASIHACGRQHFHSSFPTQTSASLSFSTFSSSSASNLDASLYLVVATFQLTKHHGNSSPLCGEYTFNLGCDTKLKSIEWNMRLRSAGRDGGLQYINVHWIPFLCCRRVCGFSSEDIWNSMPARIIPRRMEFCFDLSKIILAHWRLKLK